MHFKPVNVECLDFHFIMIAGALGGSRLFVMFPEMQ